MTGAMDLQENGTKRDAFKWNTQKEQAAQLTAENDFTADEIADQLHIGRTTFYRWKSHPEFAARVEEIKKRLGDLSMRRVIARRGRRILAQEQRWLALQQIVAERGAETGMQDIPGGQTGFLVRRIKGIGRGQQFQIVHEYEFDAALARELRELEKQAAQELGQWVEKHAPTDPSGEKEYAGGIDIDEFKRLPLAERIRLLRTASPLPMEHRKDETDST